MTRRIWQIHSWLGLIAGAALLVIGVTGSLLVFRNDLQAWLTPELLKVENPGGTPRLAQDALHAAVNRALPEHEITGWQIQRDARFADLVYVVRRGTSKWEMATVNPLAGTVLCAPMEMNDTLMGWMLEMHYSFLADHVGLLVAGLFAVMLCALGLSGLWLYRDFWRHFFRLRWRSSARIFFSDVHKMVGIPMVAFNLVFGFTGAYWNLPHAVEHLIHGEPEYAISKRLYSDAISIDELIGRAGEKIPGFRTTFISLPSSELSVITLYGRVPGPAAFRSDYGSTVTFDAGSGEWMESRDVRTAGGWARVADAFYPLHFGSFGGWPVKVIWCLAGLAPGVLAVSGFLIWFRRRARVAVPVQDPALERKAAAGIGK